MGRRCNVKAIVCQAFGMPPNLSYEDMPRPPLEPRQIRVAVTASGVNFADTVMVQGRYQVQPQPPFVPGLEAAGTVLEVGKEVKSFNVGDRVLGLTSSGAFAEEVVDDENRFFILPIDFDLKVAAALSVVYGTAHLGLIRRARLQPGETVLVLGAGGGTGLAAVEIAKVMGATVIAAASSEEKLELARNKGADHLIHYKIEDLRERVREVTLGRGVSVVFDPVGGHACEEALRSIAFEGRVIIIGFASGMVPKIKANHLLVKNVDLVGLYWGGYKVHDMTSLRASLEMIIKWIQEGQIVPYVGSEFPLREASAALDLMMGRRSIGKIILTA